MSITDGLLLAVAVLIAVRTLTGLMRRRAERLVAEVQKQVDHHREKEKERKLRERRRHVNDAA